MAIPFLPQETIRRQRDGADLSTAEIAAFVDGIARGGVSDAQCGAFAMAVCWRGLSTANCAALTVSMRDSGAVLRWPAAGLHGPLVDKHSTGGVGDSVSLVLGPLLAACGCHVPMISGRALGHTGGTLDKLEAIPGYDVQPSTARFQQVVREVGVAIVGAGDRQAPADRRLYAVRDVTATVESVPLITASILSKKLAAGLDALVLDVKFGNGAFMADEAAARALAASLVDVGRAAGLPTSALLTAMDQPLASCAGNAIEVRFAIDFLTAARPRVDADDAPDDPAASRDAQRCRDLGHGSAGVVEAPPDDAAARFGAVVFALGEDLLVSSGVAVDGADARRRLGDALAGGAAAERFARMVSALGGPADLLQHAGRHLAAAPVRRAVAAPDAARGRRVAAIDTRALGLAVIRLGGGRLRHDGRIDPAVGLDALLPLGAVAAAGRPLAIVHAATEAGADAAARAVQAAYRWADAGMAPAAAPTSSIIRAPAAGAATPPPARTVP